MKYLTPINITIVICVFIILVILNILVGSQGCILFTCYPLFGFLFMLAAIAGIVFSVYLFRSLTMDKVFRYIFVFAFLFIFIVGPVWIGFESLIYFHAKKVEEANRKRGILKRENNQVIYECNEGKFRVTITDEWKFFENQCGGTIELSDQEEEHGAQVIRINYPASRSRVPGSLSAQVYTSKVEVKRLNGKEITITKEFVKNSQLQLLNELFIEIPASTGDKITVWISFKDEQKVDSLVNNFLQHITAY